MKITNPHDKFFKEIFSLRENAVDFLKVMFSSEIVGKLDLSTLELDSNTYIDEKLKEYFSDIVYNCKGHDNELTIALLFEHKSSPVPYPHFQLLRYILNISELRIKQGKKPFPVIPIIFYHGTRTWKVVKITDYFDGFDTTFQRFIPEFEYVLVDLSEFSNEEIISRIFNRVALKMALLIMKNIFNEKELVGNLKDFFVIGKRYYDEQEGLKFLESIIRYLYNSTEIKVEEVVDILKDISVKGGKLGMTTAAKLMEKGKIEGRVEGRVEGEIKGEIKGLKSGIALGLEIKYGIDGLAFFEKMKDIESIEKLDAIKDAIKISKKLTEIEGLL